jgi:hypothetical protein
MEDRSAPPRVDYRIEPSRYRIGSWRWRAARDPATSTSPRTPASGPGYKLKLNSYDLGVDVELHDALNRIRFEHPRCARSCHQLQGARLLLGREHLHARRLAATPGR